MFTAVENPMIRHTAETTTTPRRLSLGAVGLLAGTTALTGCTELEPEVVTETVVETVTEEIEVEVEVEPADLQEQREAADERDDALDTRLATPSSAMSHITWTHGRCFDGGDADRCGADALTAGRDWTAGEVQAACH